MTGDRDFERAEEEEASPALAGNLVVVGVGGQGVILSSNVIAQVLLDAGVDVKKSEVHGMSQRGGTVVSHVRFGPEVHSVTVEPGAADWIVAFEWEEGLRALPYLKADGVAFVSTERILPPASMTDHSAGTLAYPLGVPSPSGVVAIDTLAVAGEAAVKRAAVAQTVLLGALSTRLPFPVEAWRSAIGAWAPAKTLEDNILAFERGRAFEQAAGSRGAGSSGRENGRGVQDVAGEYLATGADTSTSASANGGNGAGRRSAPFVKIEAAWCKGCNICVAVCPERCLVLDRLDVAVFAYPERCTGCELCARLCPDLAIDVIRVLVPAGLAGTLQHDEEERV